MPFAHLAAIFAKNQRYVAKNRQWQSQRLVQQNLPGRVGQMLFRTYDMRDFHQCVIQYDRIIVDWNPVRFDDHIIADAVGIKTDSAANCILECNVLIFRHPEPYSRFAPFREQRRFVRRRQLTAFPKIARSLSLCHQLLPLGIKFLIGAIATIRFTTG